MNIEFVEITVGELVAGYVDNAEEGVKGYDGQLDIRPPYQREFIYNDKQRDAVIATVMQGFPLNAMYWAVRKDGGFEIIDGQQRTLSICQFVKGDFSLGDPARYFHNWQKEEKAQFKSYKLMVYSCSGEDKEKLDWFETINIAGEELTKQELRNAVYSGSWVTAAKLHFSKNGCPAYNSGAKEYLNGTAIRQDYLETVIKWISKNDIENYMAEQQHKPKADALWSYFQDVIAWIKAVFPKYQKEMKGVDWGKLYNTFKDQELDPAVLEVEISRLMEDEDVTKKKGIYSYVLDGDERHLSIRAFSNNNKREAYERQGGICPMCGKCFEIGAMEGDHITPWHEGGKTNPENCQMLCKEDNRKKGGK